MTPFTYSNIVGPTEVGPLHLDWRPESLSLLLPFESYWQKVWLKVCLQTRYLDLWCGYLVFGYWDGPQRWTCSTLTKGQRIKPIPPCSSRMWQEVWPREWLLDLRCGHYKSCLNNRMLNPGYSCLMFQVLKQVIVLFILCVMLKALFGLLLPTHPLFGLEYISIWKINASKFSIHCIALPVLLSISIPFLFFSFLSLFLLSNISNPHTPTPTDVAPMLGQPQQNVWTPTVHQSVH